jgi:DNA-binding transcriptional regulator YhcF (GntR family)
LRYTFKSSQPIFEQIIEYLVVQIVNNNNKEGDRVLSVRDYAIEFGVNPNTVQRALAELERLGILYSKRGDGRFVADSSKASAICERIANQKAKQYNQEMQKMGFQQIKL